MFEIKNYQERAIDRLKEETNSLLNYADSKICVFKAPTGSGKTIMMAEFLKRLVTFRTDGRQLSFIWISVNKLHDQSRQKLDKYFEDSRIIKCSEFEDLDNKQISENEILFFNWQSINKRDNLYIRENEHENNLSKVVENTKEAGREVILIIDESQNTANAEKSIKVIEAIAPKITIEVSATPQIKEGLSTIVNVEFQDVIAEGMIKREIAINPEIDKTKVDKKTADEFVIGCALKKRQELKMTYEKEGSGVNPLVLIQLPDAKAGVIDRREDIEKILKDKFKITTENRKLAIYLSDKDSKVNLENIEKSDNEIEVLIFKQAIAIGWDCPRAAILVLFRDWKSVVFSIQTVGRIMRMPEFKHYDEDILNIGYIFTNIADISIAEEVAKDYLTIYQSKRQSIYEPLDLNAVYLIRQREKTRLSGEFSKILLAIAQKDRTNKEINMKPSELVNELMVDGKIVKLDKAQVVQHEGELEVGITEKELQYRFDLFVRSTCAPFAPADSSGRIKTALYNLFDTELKTSDYEKAQILIMAPENNDKIRALLNKTKEAYQAKVVRKLSEKREIHPIIWNVPPFIDHNSRYKEAVYHKNIMKPCYIKSQSRPEEEFIAILEQKDNKVKWWYQNGESEVKYFAIKYTDEQGSDRTFYPDFIIMMEDGSVGIFDTKSGMTAKVAKPKSEALAKYIKQEKTKYGKKLCGGIVVLKDGNCRYNDKETYQFDEGNLGKDWDFLSFI